MDKNWIYYGVFFSPNIKEQLIQRAKNLINIPENWTLYADHMTIVFNDGSEAKQLAANGLEILLNETIQLHISSIGMSEEAIAFGIDNYQTQNKQSHVTIAVAPGSKPVKSNDIVDWLPIDGFSITGKLNKIVRR